MDVHEIWKENEPFMVYHSCLFSELMFDRFLSFCLSIHEEQVQGSLDPIHAVGVFLWVVAPQIIMYIRKKSVFQIGLRDNF